MSHHLQALDLIHVVQILTEPNVEEHIRLDNDQALKLLYGWLEEHWHNSGGSLTQILMDIGHNDLAEQIKHLGSKGLAHNDLMEGLEDSGLGQGDLGVGGFGSASLEVGHSDLGDWNRNKNTFHHSW